MPRAHSVRKRRRTFTLSPESLSYLEHETRRRGADSQSSVLDEVLREKNLEQQRAALEAQISAYYDSVSADEIEEDRAWGEFAGSHLALNEEELSHVQPTAGRNLVHEAADRPSGKRKAAGRDRVHQRSKPTSTR